MARIRSAKPEFWTDPAMLSLPRDLRFTFKGLWEVCADDEGRFLADPRIVKGQLWPVEDDITAKKLGAWLETLHARGRIVLYDVGGARYGVITNWRKHQKISHPLPSKHPAPPNEDGNIPESLQKNSGTSLENFRSDVDVDFDFDKEKEEDVEARRGARGDSSNGARIRQPGADLLARLPEPFHSAIAQAVAECDRPAALAAELRAALDGMHGPPVAPDVVGQAVHDLVANGDHKRFNARLVRRYLAGVDPPAKQNGNGHASASPLATDAERAFQDAMALIRDTPGGWRQITADTLASLPPRVRAGIRAADGVRALADADEFTLRAKRKLFTAAYLSCQLKPE